MKTLKESKHLLSLILLFILLMVFVSAVNLYLYIHSLNNILEIKQILLLKKEIEDLNIKITLISTLFISIGIIVSIPLYVKIKEYKAYMDKTIQDLEIAQSVSHMGSWTLDVKKNELIWSKESYKIFEADYNEKRLTSSSFMDYIHPDDRDLVRTGLEQSIENHSPFHATHRLLLKSGKEKIVEAKGEVTYHTKINGQEKIIFNGTVQDITLEVKKEKKLKEKEKLLQEQKKLASMGNLMVNIAHQWRQPLSIISTCASGVSLKNELNTLEKEELEEFMNKILSNVDYLTKTIESFRNSNTSESISNFDVKEIIEEVLKNKQNLFDENNIQIETKLEDNLSLTNFSINLKKSLTNILLNSKEALNDNKTLNDKFILIECFKNEDKKVEINIKDNAGGVKEEILDKILDPYYTTKYKSQGKGLGLNVTYRLITQGMKGELYVRNDIYTHKNKSYKGLMFKIIL